MTEFVKKYAGKRIVINRLIAHMRISENAVCILERNRFSGDMTWLGEGPTLVHAFANARAKFLAWRK